MLEPVHPASLWQRWPVLVAAAACILFMVALGARREPPRALAPREPTAAAAPLHSISVQVYAVDVACERADAGACDPSPTSSAASVAPDAPIAGARVRVLRTTLTTEGPQISPWGSARSDELGRAEVSAPPGVYWLLVDAPGRARRSDTLTFDGSGAPRLFRLPRSQPLEVEVRDPRGQPIPGATVLVRSDDALPHGARTSSTGLARFENVSPRVDDIRVSAPGYDTSTVSPSSRSVLVTLSTPAVLEILVEDAAGQPAAEAEVWVSGIDFWPPRQTRAGPEGTARLEGLSRGTYDLRARSGKWVSAGTTGLTLERGEHARVTLRLVEGQFVSVRVCAGEGDAAPPVVGADVTLVEDGLSPFPLSARTDADGRSLLGPLPLGSAVLNVRADGFMPESAPVPRQLHAEVRMALLRGGRVSGRVLDSDGFPIEGARLEVVGNDVRGRPIARQSGALDVPRGFFERSLAAPLPLVPMGELGVLAGPLPIPGMPPTGDAPRSAWVSDLDGRYRLDEVPPGRLRLLVRHPDFIEALSDTLALDPGGTAAADVVLQRGATLSGRLLDELGRPVSRARVDAQTRQATGHSALTLDDGTFVFRAVPARVDLLVTRPEDRHRFVLRRSLELSPGERREVELTLPAPRPSLGVVTLGEDDRPVAGAVVTLLSLDPGVPLRQSAESDAVGESLLPDAVGLVATLRVQAPGWRAFEAELDPVPPRIEVSLVRGVTVGGRVTQSGGRQGVGGAEVVLLQGGQRLRALTDDNGEYELTSVAFGPATLSVRHRELSSETWEVEIAPGQREGRAQELEAIDLEEPGSVSGTVLDALGEPVRGARVGVGLVPAFVPAAAALPGLVESDARGRFELRGLAPGRLTLSAYAAGVGRGSLSGVEVVAGESTTGVELRLDESHLEAEPAAMANVAVTLGERQSGGDLQVLIVDVAAGSEAERAGVRRGDVLWSVDDDVVTDMVDARQLLGGSDGSDVILELERDGETLSVRVRREAVR